MRTNYTALMLSVFLAFGVSCTHEIPSSSIKWEVEIIIDRGNILDLGVSKSQVCILNTKPEIGVLDLETQKWQFYNRINSLIDNVSDIQGVGDSLVCFGDDAIGLFTIGDTGIIPIDTTRQTVGFDFSGDRCRANIKGLVLFSNGLRHTAQNQFRMGSTKLSSMAAKDDTIWVGTQAYGLFYADMVNRRIRQTSYTRTAGFRVKQVTYDQMGNLWVVTEKGVTKKRKGNWRVYPGPSGLKINHMTLLDETVYLATDKGVYTLDMNSGEYTARSALNAKMPYPYINVIEADCEGHLWVGTGIGLVRCRPL